MKLRTRYNWSFWQSDWEHHSWRHSLFWRRCARKWSREINEWWRALSMYLDRQTNYRSYIDTQIRTLEAWMYWKTFFWKGSISNGWISSWWLISIERIKVGSTLWSNISRQYQQIEKIDRLPDMLLQLPQNSSSRFLKKLGGIWLSLIVLRSENGISKQ